MSDPAKTEAPFVTTASLAASDPFRLLVEAVEDYGLFMVDPAGAITSWNPGAAKSKGYSAEEALGRHISMFYTAEDVAAGEPDHELQTAFEVGRYEAEGLRVRKGGETFWALATISRVNDAFGNHLGFANVTRDLSERKAAEDALQQNARLVRNLVDHLPHRIVVKDRQSVTLFCNANYARDLGLAPSEIVGKDAFSFHPRELAEAYHADDREVMERGVVKRIEEPYVSAEHSGWMSTVKVPYRDEAGAIIGLLAVFEDITERRQLEENLRQANRLEAIGHLAGGVAHDFNNLLGVITGYGEIAHQRLSSDDPLLEEVGQILKASERATNLTRQLLAFGRKQILQPRTLDLNAVVSELERMLARLLGEQITFETRLDPRLGNVRADPGQIEQVLMNLLINARDAMPGGGRILIETRNVETAPDPSSGFSLVTLAPYVMIAVSDTGTGMDEPTRARIFEPFFTTKEMGKGTGLGLATVHGIVSQSDGFLRVQSAVGSGTTFQVFLPRIEDVVELVREASADPIAPGREKVLLVEDEDALRELLLRVLESSGYVVLAARDAREALACAEAEPGPIEILVTDMILPGLSGLALADRLAVLRPDLKVLYISGYSEEAVQRKGLSGPGRAFLTKPFRLRAMLGKVRDLLDA